MGPRRLVSLLGMLVVVAYLNHAWGWVALPARVSLALAFALGPVAVLGVLGLSGRLESGYSPGRIRAGRVALIAAFSILTVMVTIQQAIVAEYRVQYATASDAAARAALKLASALVGQVQLGADVAFDVFYGLGLMTWSLAFVAHDGLARWTGVYGLLVSVGLLTLNVWTFPSPPTQAGLPDLGPATIVWWVCAVLLARRTR